MKLGKALSILLSGILILGCSRGKNSEVSSIEWVCENYEERVVDLLEAIDLEYPGMEQVKTAYGENDLAGACYALVDYYKQSETGKWIRNSELRDKIWIRLSRDTTILESVPAPSGSFSSDSVANNILQNVFSINVDRAVLKTGRDGSIDWLDTGPFRDQEWAFNLNRHYFMVNLLNAWFETGNPDYSSKFNDLIMDWVQNNPPVDHMTQKACWRELETGRRLTAVWPVVFYGFQASGEFTPAARILMLSSITDHTEYLMHFYKKYHNKSTTALYGLASAGCFWPEFIDSDTWLDSAIRKMDEEIRHQVYPDGTQIELTNGYHFSVAERFQALADMADFCGREVAGGYLEKVESMVDYAVYSSTPAGNAVMNNDAGLNNIREEMGYFEEKYDRQDWRYILTNGSEGVMPPHVSSVMFPWGGQLITRNGWDANAQWGFFDIGPWGRAHQHHDALNICISAYGRDLLVDAGSYTYNVNLQENGLSWRSYFVGSESHNLILINEKGQYPNDSFAIHPIDEKDYIISPAFDFARGSFSSGFSIPQGDIRIATRGFEELKDTSQNIVHTRNLLYLRDKFWVVVDQVRMDKPARIDVLWHFHPDCTVEMESGSVASVDQGRGNLKIIPLSNLRWDINLVSGQTEPVIQGWYSPSGKVKQAGTAAIFTAHPDSTATFCWLLIPASGPVADEKAEILKLDNELASILVHHSDLLYNISVPVSSGKPTINEMD